MVDELRKAARHHERMKREARLSDPDEEDSTVIDQRALERSPKSSSTPAPAKSLVAVLNSLPPWGRVIFLLALLAAIVATGGTKLAGLW